MSFWDTLRERLDEIGSDIGNWVPKILGALLILIVGLLIARIVRRIVKRILENDAVEGVPDKAGIGPALRNSGYSAANLGATLVYGLMAIVVLLLAATALEVQSLVDLLERLIGFIPVVFVAIVLAVVAAAIGSFLADLARPWAETHNSSWVPTAVRWGVIVFALLTAFDLVGIGQVSEDLRRAVLLAGGVAFAVAFGGVDTAKKWWAKYLSPRDSSSFLATTDRLGGARAGPSLAAAPSRSPVPVCWTPWISILRPGAGSGRCWRRSSLSGRSSHRDSSCCRLASEPPPPPSWRGST